MYFAYSKIAAHSCCSTYATNQPRILAMKSKPVKRKSTYDSDIECDTVGASKKKNSESVDTFPHLSIIGPTQKGNPLDREHIYGSTDITSESVSDCMSTPTPMANTSKETV